MRNRESRSYVSGGEVPDFYPIPGDERVESTIEVESGAEAGELAVEPGDGGRKPEVPGEGLIGAVEMEAAQVVMKMMGPMKRASSCLEAWKFSTGKRW